MTYVFFLKSLSSVHVARVRRRRRWLYMSTKLLSRWGKRLGYHCCRVSVVVPDCELPSLAFDGRFVLENPCIKPVTLRLCAQFFQHCFGEWRIFTNIPDRAIDKDNNDVRIYLRRETSGLTYHGRGKSANHLIPVGGCAAARSEAIKPFQYFHLRRFRDGGVLPVACDVVEFGVAG